ncbi:MFS transporter [Stenotrophomonas maltophilia]|uniref:MFS transporter n=1 Tax=Stenotrophomonas maltophilia TaxID=40324 RepID=UPI0013138CDB|nr:MFS transporter [Stenotrophomonas maltophilia]MDG2507749.1 MFS transporter [Stenotrophomonas maltophilia]
MEQQGIAVPGTRWGDLLSGRNAVRSLALAGGVALHAVNVYIATTMLPTVVEDIGGLDLYAWNTTLFVVASILGSALSIKLLERAGPRGSYALATLIFAAGAVICALATSMPMMLVGRLVQGVGGGFLFALAYAMIRLAFEEPLWPRAMALVSGMWGVATLIGPAVGGVFAEWGVWRAAFWSVTAVAVLFALLASNVLPQREASSSAAARSSVPWLQILLLTLAVISVSLGSTSSSAVNNFVGIVMAVFLAVVLMRIESRAKQTLLPSGALRLRSRLAALYGLMSLLVVMITSGEVFVPLFLQVLHQQSPLAAGYLAALMAAGWTLGSLVGSGFSGRAVDRALMIGPALGWVGMIGLALRVPAAGSGTWLQMVPICVALAVIGIGVGLAWPHLLTRVLTSAPPEEQERAGASITTVQLFATAAGAALAGMVANAAGLIEPGGAEGTARAARWLFATFALAPMLGMLLVKRCRFPADVN